MKITLKSTLLSISVLSLALVLSSCCNQNRPHHGPKCHHDHKDKKAHHKLSHFKKMDKNSDGKITKKEFNSNKSNHFNKIDLNNDGEITKNEMKKSHRKMRKERCRE